MTKQFDFNEIGKKTPYRVPEGFFDEMQKQVMEEVEKPSHSKLSIAHISSIVIGIAAVVLAFVFFPYSNDNADSIDNAIAQPMSINWIEQLSDDDLQILNEISENDIFMD